MIVISGENFDISKIASEYEKNSIEMQILNKMSESREKYKYNSLDTLKFELSMRKEIVNSAIALNESGLSFANFKKSRCNPEYWNLTEEGGFKLKDDVSPVDAINDIYINGNEYATECATAIMIVYYKALLNVFGKELFDEKFNKIYLFSWYVREPLLREVKTPRKVADILLGDRGYFENPDVNPKTPEWQGENVIVLPNSLYYGHGIGINTADNIIESLNNNRTSNATESAYFMDSVGRPNFKKLAYVYKNPNTLVWNPFPSTFV